MPSLRRCGHVRIRSRVHTVVLRTTEANLLAHHGRRIPAPPPRRSATDGAATARSWRPLRRVRGGRRRACAPRRELQPTERAHRPKPLPRVRAASRAQPGAPKRHPGELDHQPIRRRACGREGSRAILQRPALAQRHRERAPARAGRLQHPARRPARAHAASQGCGSSVHQTETDGAEADHRGARQRPRGPRREARRGGVDGRGRTADGDEGDASHAGDRRRRGNPLASMVDRSRSAARDDRDASRAKDRAPHGREHHGVLPRAPHRTHTRRGR